MKTVSKVIPQKRACAVRECHNSNCETLKCEMTESYPFIETGALLCQETFLNISPGTFTAETFYVQYCVVFMSVW